MSAGRSDKRKFEQRTEGNKWTLGKSHLRPRLEDTGILGRDRHVADGNRQFPTMWVWFAPLDSFSSLLFPTLFPGGRTADPYQLHPWVSLAICLSVRFSQKEALEDWRTGYKWDTGATTLSVWPVLTVAAFPCHSCHLPSTAPVTHVPILPLLGPPGSPPDEHYIVPTCAGTCP